MLESVVAAVLEKALGTFLDGLNSESLSLSIWRGDFTLRNIALRADAINALHLPVRVCGGVVHSIEVEVPWRELTTKPIVLTVKGVRVLLASKDADEPYDEEAEAAKERQEKQRRLELWEAVEEKKGMLQQMGENMVNALVEKLLHKLCVRLSDVHVRVEACAAGALPVAAGFTLRSLTLENLSTLIVGGAKAAEALVHKAIDVHGFAVYLDGDMGAQAEPPGDASEETGAAVEPLGMTDVGAQTKPVDDAGDGKADGEGKAEAEGEGARVAIAALALSDGVGAATAAVAEASGGKNGSSRALADVEAPPLAECRDCGDDDEAPLVDVDELEAKLAPMLRCSDSSSHVLRPVDASLYAIYDPQAASSKRTAAARPQMDLRFALAAPLSLSLKRSQLISLISLAEDLSRSDRRHRFRACRRPEPEDGARAWWQYARRAVMVMLAASRMQLTWVELKRRRERRLSYIRLFTDYTAARGSKKTELHKALVAAEDDLAFEEITSWRTLARYHAHKQAQQPKRSEGGGRGFFGLFSGGGDEKSGRKSLSDADLANIAHELGLHEQAMHKTGPTDFHPAWVQVIIAADFPGVQLQLMLDEEQPLVELRLDRLSARSRFRAVNSGVALEVSAASIALLDLATPHDDALRVLAHTKTSRKTGHWFHAFLETEPLSSDAALTLHAELGGTSVLLNPRTLASLLLFTQLPPSHWRTAAALEGAARSLISGLVASLQEAAAQWWRGRALAIALSAAPIRMMLLDPPPLRAQGGQATRGGGGGGGVAAAAAAAADARVSGLTPASIDNEANADDKARGSEAHESSEALCSRHQGICTADVRPTKLELRSIALELGELTLNTSDSSTKKPRTATRDGGKHNDAESPEELLFFFEMAGTTAALLPPLSPPALLRETSLSALAEPIVAPLDARVRVSVRLKPAAAHVPLLDAALSLSPLRCALRETQIVHAAQTLLRANQCLTKALTNQAAEAEKSAFVRVTVERSFAGRVALQEIGISWVVLRQKKLVFYCTDKGSRIFANEVELTPSIALFQRGTDVELSTTYSAGSSSVGLELRWRLLLHADSPSAASKWMSAIASQQILSADPLTSSSQPLTSPAQLQLHLVAQLPEMSFELLPAQGAQSPLSATVSLQPQPDGGCNATVASQGDRSGQRGDAPHAPHQALHARVPPPLRVAVTSLSVVMSGRMFDTHASVHVGAANATANADGEAVQLFSGLSARAGDGNGILSIDASLVSSGSPMFEEAKASANLALALQTVQFEVAPSAVQLLRGVVVRLGNRFEMLLAESAVPDVSIPPTQEQQLSALRESADSLMAAAEAQGANRQAEPRGSATGELDEAQAESELAMAQSAEGKPILSLKLSCSRLGLQLLQLAPSDASAPAPSAAALVPSPAHAPGRSAAVAATAAAATAAAAAAATAAAAAAPNCLVNAGLEDVQADLELRAQTFMTRASVRSVSVAGHDGAKHVDVVRMVRPSARDDAERETRLSSRASADDAHTSSRLLELRVQGLLMEESLRRGVDVALSSRPVRVLLDPRLVLRVGDWVQGLQEDEAVVGAAEEAVASASQAAQEAANNALASAASQPPIPLRLDVRLAGPLVVLPSAAAARSALVLMSGDVLLSNSMERETDAEGESLWERVELTLHKTRLFVTSTGRALDDDWMLRDDFTPHLILSPISLQLKLDRRIVEGGADANLPGEIRLFSNLSAVSIECSSSECVFGYKLANELLEILDQSADASANADATLIHEVHADARAQLQQQHKVGAHGADGQPQLGGPGAPNKDQTGPPAQALLLTVAVEASVRVRIVDDVLGAAPLPLYELSLEDMIGEAKASFNSGDLRAASLRMGAQVAASHFNPNNGFWEPMVERWRADAVGLFRPPEQLSVEVVAPELLQLNLTHAMVVSAIETFCGIQRIVHGDVSSDIPREGEIRFRNCAICNLTELDVELGVRDEEGNALDVAAGERTSFDAPFALASQSHGEYAETSFSDQLMQAARTGDKALASILLERFANPNAADSQGRRPLHRAAKYKHPEMIQILISAQADVNLPTEDHLDMYALHFAAQSGCLRSCRLLLEAHANPAAVNTEGVTAADLAQRSICFSDDVVRLLYDASANGVAMRGRRFASVELVHLAASGQESAVREALRARADPDSTDGTLSALQRACAHGHVDVAMVLIESGVAVNAPSPMREYRGITALGVAARTGSFPMVALLLGNRADPCQVQSPEGTLPLDLVSWMCSHEGGEIRCLLKDLLEERALARGTLSKLGAERKSWRRRYFVLLPNQLRYYSDADLAHPKGSVMLSMHDEVKSPSAYPGLPSPFSLELTSASRTTVLCADSEAELSVWLSAINRVLKPELADTSQSLRFGLTEHDPAAAAGGQGMLKSSARSRQPSAAALALAAARTHPAQTSGSANNTATATATATALVAEAAPPSAASARGAEDHAEENDDDEAAAHSSLDVSVGEFSTVRVPFARLGSSLHQLRARDGSRALIAAALCDVRFQRGQRLLSVRSACELCNETVTPIQILMQTTSCEQQPMFVLKPGEGKPLPLSLTLGGSEGVRLQVCVRPELGKSESAYSWGTMVPIAEDLAVFICPEESSSDVVGGEGVSAGLSATAASAEGDAVANGEADGDDGGAVVEAVGGEARSDSRRASSGGGKQTREGRVYRMWFACARVERPPRELEQYTATGRKAERRRAELRSFNLPPSEVLLQCWPVIAPPGWLYLTPNYVCFCSNAVLTKSVMPFQEIMSLQGGSSHLLVRPSKAIEIVLRDGRRHTYGELGDRDATLAQLRLAARRAQQARASGLGRWQPLTIHFTPPVTITNAMLCSVNVRLKQSRRADWLSQLVDPNLREDAGKKEESGISTNEQLHVEEVRTLAAGAQQTLHTVLGLLPMDFAVWLDGSSYMSARLHGHVKVQRKMFAGGQAEGKPHVETVVMTLHPPQQPNSSKAVRMQVAMEATAGGSFHLTLSSPHWMSNRSSVPIELCDTVPSVGAVLRVDGDAPEPAPFSLSLGGSNAYIRCAAFQQGGGVPSAFQRGINEALAASRAFSIEAIGYSSTVEVGLPGNRFAELALDVSAVGSNIFVTLYDRYVIRNRCLVDLEWRQQRNEDDENKSFKAGHCRSGGHTSGSGGGIHGSGCGGGGDGAQPPWVSPHSDAASASSLDGSVISADGRRPVYWSTKGKRNLCVRPRSGTHEWCAPFSPEKVSDGILKLRPARAGEPLRYVRATSELLGTRRTVTLREPGEAHQLPYEIVNETGMLLAFRQPRCAHYDLLGAGESVGYALDLPDGDRALLFEGREPWLTHSLEVTSCSLERLGKSTTLKWSETGDSLGKPAYQTQTRSPAAVPMRWQGALCGAAAVLMSASAALMYGEDKFATGWLVLTDSQLTFITFREERKELVAEGMLQHHQAHEHAGEPHASESIKWLSTSELPLDLATLTIEGGDDDDKLWVHAPKGVLRLSGMRDTSTAKARIELAIQFSVALADARKTMRELKMKHPEEQLQPHNKTLRRGKQQHGKASSSAAVSRARSQRHIPTYKGPPRAAAAPVPEHERGEYARVIQAAARRGSVSMLVKSLRKRVNARQHVGALLCRPPFAVSLDREDRVPSAALVAAVAKGEPGWAVERLLQQRADPDYIDPSTGVAAIHVAIANNRLALLNLLLVSGADIEMEVRDNWRSRPLHVAIRTAAFGVGLAGVKLLLNSGADPTSRRSDGVDCQALATPASPIDRLIAAAVVAWRPVREVPSRAALTPLARASAVSSSRSGSSGSPAAQPAQDASPVDAPKMIRRAALVHAAAAGRYARVAALLKRTDPVSLDEHGNTALHVAAARADVPMLALLLRAGASPNAIAANDVGARPLHCAALSGSLRCVRLLLRAGANPTLPDLAHHLPLERCAPWAHQARALLVSAVKDATFEKRVNPASAFGISRRAATFSAGSARPAVPSTPVRALLLKRGPGRELRLVQREGAGGDVAEELVEATGGGRNKAEISLRLAGLGVSLIDAEPCELLHASMLQLQVKASVSDSDVNLELLVGQVQVDNSIESTKHPVVLQPLEAQVHKADDESDGCLHLVYTQNLKWDSLLYIEQFEVALQPLRLTLEQNMSARLLRFSWGVLKLWEESKAELDVILSELDSGDSDGDAADAAPSGAAASSGDGGSGSRFGGGSCRAGEGSGTLPVAARVTSEALKAAAPSGSTALELYFKSFKIHPVVFVATLQMEPLCDDPALQEWHPVHSVQAFQRLLLLQNSHIELNCLELNESSLESMESLVTRVVLHYTWQALQSVYKQVLSLDILGNPGAVFADMGDGVREFFYQPSKGLVKSPKAFAQGLFLGTRGLAGGVVGGAGGVVNMFSALTRIVDNAAGVLTMDKTYQYNRALAQQRQATRAGQGLRMGVEALGEGFRAGAVGVVSAPLSGAMDDGVRGFAKGLGRGLLGAIAKPLSGVAAFASKTTEGVASEVRRIRAGGVVSYGLRVRQPRALGPNAVLLPYPPTPPISVASGDDARSKFGGGGAGDAAVPMEESPRGAVEQALAELDETHEQDEAIVEEVATTHAQLQ